VNFADLDHSIEDPNAPGVARVWHEWVDGSVANLIQVEAALRGLSVICEPAHELTLATGGGHGAGGQRPNVTIDPTVAAQAVSSQLPATAAGRKVAVLDTGDLSGSRPTMVDFLKGQPDVQAACDDLNGHGTAVAQLLREVNPSADVYIVRVVQDTLTSTYELLCGLTYVMWPGLYDLVSVSLTQKMPGGCVTMLGASLDMVLEICRRYGKSVPILVAAAGNSTSGQGFAYPAKLSGAVVVQAWDWQQSRASNNVKLDPTVQPVFASGGDDSSPSERSPVPDDSPRSSSALVRRGRRRRPHPSLAVAVGLATDTSGTRPEGHTVQVRAVEQPQLQALLREWKPPPAQHLVLVEELEAKAGPGQAGDDFAELVAPLVGAVLGPGVGVGGEPPVARRTVVGREGSHRWTTAVGGAGRGLAAAVARTAYGRSCRSLRPNSPARPGSAPIPRRGGCRMPPAARDQGQATDPWTATGTATPAGWGHPAPGRPRSPAVRRYRRCRCS
jgi:Subtilase family